MLAYLFWHRPYPTVERQRYEESLRSFQRSLAREPPPGFHGAASYRIPAVPWLEGEGGYEDWCYVEGSWALDPLNAFAVAAPIKGSHDTAAAQMAVGHGGLYALIWGAPDFLGEQTVTWMTRPRGLDWRAVLEPLRKRFPEAVFWRRQMVLGPAPEFAVVAPSERPVAAPANWSGLPVSGQRL